MKGEIITIGNELTSGQTLDLNARYIAERLTSYGLFVNRITSVGDDHHALEEAINHALEKSSFIIATGGLGSTRDDITTSIVARTTGRPLKTNELLRDKIHRLVSKRGGEMTPSLEKMAMMPEGSKIIDQAGNVCGYSLVEGKCLLFFLPGVPEQMRYMLDKFVLPEILSNCDALPAVRQRLLKLYGIGEPEIAEIFEDIKFQNPDVQIGFYPNFPENHIVIRLRIGDESDADGELDRIESKIRKVFGSYIFAINDKTLEAIVGEILGKEGMTLSLAESCTGGLIGQRITKVPGSSRYFEGGIIVYSNQAKVNLLGVSPATLQSFGAVSKQTVIEMAKGIKEKMNTSLGLAITGIAGPEGGTKEKPIGTVHIGLASEKGINSEKYHFIGDRDQIRLDASTMALDWIRRYVYGYPFIPGI
jgi:nicotinamide-nucleotide amidase